MLGVFVLHFIGIYNEVRITFRIELFIKGETLADYDKKIDPINIF